MRKSPRARDAYRLVQFDRVPYSSRCIVGVGFLVDQRTFHLKGKGLIAIGSGENLDCLTSHLVQERLVLPSAEVRNRLASGPSVHSAEQTQLVVCGIHISVASDRQPIGGRRYLVRTPKET